MVTIKKLSRDTPFNRFDYVFEDEKRFDKLLPYLYPKLEDTWSVAIIEPKMPYIRTLLTTSYTPNWIDITVFLDKGGYDQISLEFPKILEVEKSPWEQYMELLKTRDVTIADNAAKELYFRAGPRLGDLEAALDKLKDIESISLKDISKVFPPVSRVYAKQVAQAFLNQDKKAWFLYSKLEQELGIEYAYYSIRKYINKLFKEKDDYLLNKPTKDKAVTSIDAYSVNLAYFLFSQSTSPKQLPAIMSCVERRAKC